MYCWIQFANILLRIFVSIFIKYIDLEFSFFAVSFSGFSIRVTVVIVQLLNRVQLFATPWTSAHPILYYLLEFLKLMYIELVIPPNYLILCHPFLPLHSFFPRIRVFFNESALCIRWPKYWSFSFGIGPPSEYSGLISFRIDWFALSAVQWTLKSLLQHHSSKTSILWLSTFFVVQLLHPYLTTGKNIAFTICTFVGKMSLFLIQFLHLSFLCFQGAGVF